MHRHSEVSGLWKVLLGRQLNDGVVGFCGSISAVCGMRDNWTKSIV